MVLVIAAGCVAWVATGRLGSVSQAGIEQTSVALDDAITLADSTAEIARQIEDSLVSVALGMGAAAEATGNIVTVSENVRKILRLASFFNNVEDLTNSLADTEASLLEAQGALSETQDNLVAAEPGVAQAVVVLAGVPAQLRETQQKLVDTTDRVDGYVALLRTMIVLIVIALLLLFYVIDRMARQMAALSPIPVVEPAQP